MIDTLTSTLNQLFVLTLIPFLVYIIRARKIKGFANYIGLKKSNNKANGLALLLMLFLATPLLLFAAVDASMLEVFQDPKSVTGNIRAMGFGFETVLTILIVAGIKTSLSEEILFRGFIAKRLIALTGFKTGNLIQAVIFGAIHPLFFLGVTSNPIFLTIIFIAPTIGAYIKVYLNEKLADGSIVPGWIAHATGNVMSYTMIAFVL
ncbi:MAG: CPBP family intramembrane glutamic endopeptidase [Bacteroidota bacterium]